MKHKHAALLLQRATSLRRLNQTRALLTKSGLAHHPHLLLRLVALAALSPWGSLHLARSLFDSAPTPSLPLFNIIIRAYALSISPLQSLHLYNRLCRLFLHADHLTFPFLLKAIARFPAIEPQHPISPLLIYKGSEIHCRILHLGLSNDNFIQNSLISMYSYHSRIEDARQVFDEMTNKCIVSYNTMVAAYNRCGDSASADQILISMPEKNVASWNSIITRHMRAGDITAARRIFEEMAERDAISWNTMIAGYARLKDYAAALRLFKQMQVEKCKPTELTMVSVLGACAETGALDIGMEIHSYLRESKFKIEGFLGNALLDMYAKCGRLNVANQVFDEMGLRHVSCWNSMITALAVHGHSEEALELFNSLERESNSNSTSAARPNSITFLGVLLACSHKGLVEQGRVLFRRMGEEYGMKPGIKHYGCMIDMLSRCGHLEEAFWMIRDMPIKANSVLWKSVLNSCGVYGNVEFAERAFRELAELEPLCDGVYVLMSNIYAEAERWSDVERLRCGMIGNNISKQPGFSQIGQSYTTAE